MQYIDQAVLPFSYFKRQDRRSRRKMLPEMQITESAKNAQYWSEPLGGKIKV